jgi:hypothetical protein
VVTVGGGGGGVWVRALPMEVVSSLSSFLLLTALVSFIFILKFYKLNSLCLFLCLLKSLEKILKIISNLLRAR